MDPVDNPFNAGAGTPPEEFVGREAQIRQFETLLRRLSAGRADQQLMITGLRGVGKTVLLNHLEGVARELNWLYVSNEVSPHEDFRARIALLCSRALQQLTPATLRSEIAKRAWRVLGSFSLTYNPDGSITGGISEPEPGAADSGQLDDDLIDLFEAVGMAARDSGTGVVFALDELQELNDGDLGAAVAAVHRVSSQQALPVALLAAGLPQLVPRVVRIKGYAERLFAFAELGRLSDQDVERALRAPAERQDVEFTDDAIAAIIERSEGYPYFVQLFGKASWNLADDPIGLEDIAQATILVERELDEGFFSARLSVATEGEVRFLRALVEDGNGPYVPSAAGNLIGLEAAALAAMVSACESKHLIYEKPGELFAFTVPHFDRYLLRRMPNLAAC